MLKSWCVTMAEMTAAQAIKVLHNNQYQKHIGNGDYDYIHPLTDTEAKGIENLIKQQAQEIAKKDGMLEKAIDQLETACCDAPQSFDCEETGQDCRKCWLAWLEKEAEVTG